MTSGCSFLNASVVLIATVGVAAAGEDQVIAKVRRLYDSGKTHYDLGEYQPA